jgi:anti-sigma factor RsiW
MNHWNEEEIARWVDGEGGDDAHLRDCARCSHVVLAAMQLKRAIREAAPRYEVPESLRRRVIPSDPERSEGESRDPLALAKGVPRLAALARDDTRWVFAAAAMVVIVLAALVIVRMREAEPMRELVDMHVTLLASANAVDVISTDRHTVKPWFEGRVPFAVPVPDLPAPFRLIGGRVVYWHQQPGAYLLIGKGAHRISLFIFRDSLHTTETRDVTSEVWRSDGLTYVAIADVSQGDLAALRRAFK